MQRSLRTENRLDRTDWRILEALQENCRLSFSALARRLGLSAPTVAERVRRMEDAGIITGFHTSVAFEKAGYGITAIIRVSAPEENCTKLGGLVRRLPCVVESYRVTGADRLVIKVAARSVEELDSIVRELSRLGTVTVAIILSHRTHVVRPEGSLSTA